MGYHQSKGAAHHALRSGDLTAARVWFDRYRGLVLEDLERVSLRYGVPECAEFVVAFEPPGGLRDRAVGLVREAERRSAEYQRRMESQ